MQQELALAGLETAAYGCVILLPAVVVLTGLLMVSSFRYPHLVNRYLRGRRSIARLLAVLALILLIVVAHRYVIAIGTLAYAACGPASWAWVHFRPKHAETAPQAAAPLPHSSPGR